MSQPKSTRAVAILIRDDEIMLMFRRREGKEYYVLPGGGVEADETVKQATVRELLEETSIEAKIEKLLYHHKYDNNTEQFFFLCRFVKGEPRLSSGCVEEKKMKKDPDEYYEPLWIKLESLPKLLVYPLEVRDWIINDWPKNFPHPPQKAAFKICQLRQEL